VFDRFPKFLDTVVKQIRESLVIKTISEIHHDQKLRTELVLRVSSLKCFRKCFLASIGYAVNLTVRFAYLRYFPAADESGLSEVSEGGIDRAIASGEEMLER
jgi:hypothetical protein